MTGKTLKGDALVTFMSAEEANKACASLHRQVLWTQCVFGPEPNLYPPNFCRVNFSSKKRTSSKPTTNSWLINLKPNLMQCDWFSSNSVATRADCQRFELSVSTESQRTNRSKLVCRTQWYSTAKQFIWMGWKVMVLETNVRHNA